MTLAGRRPADELVITDDPSADEPGADAPGSSRGAAAITWRRRLATVAGVFLFSRFCVLIGAGIVAAEVRADANTTSSLFPGDTIADPHYAGRVVPTNALRIIVDVLTSWDGNWYLQIARGGYPQSVSDPASYLVPDARAVFFPLYPLLVRWVDVVLPGSDVAAGLTVNLVLGALAVYLVGCFARRLYGDDVAQRTMILLAVFPGSFVLSFAYTEPLLIVLAAACMLCILDERWLAAGVLAALGSATRPNGLALVAACAVAAGLAIHGRRQWRALPAVLLAPLGFVVFQLWLNHHTGERWVWFRVQSQAWDEGLSLGWRAVSDTIDVFRHPLSSPTDILTAASLATTVLLVWFAWKRRLPGFAIAYVVVVLALMLLPDTVTARPRFVFTAFPLFISAAAWFAATPRRELWTYVVAASSVGLVAVTAVYGVFGAIP